VRRGFTAVTPEAAAELIAYSSPTGFSPRGQADKARREMRLTDLPSVLLEVVASQLHANYEFAAALTCRALREAVAHSEHRAARGMLSTSITSLFRVAPSIAKLAWAVASGLPLFPTLLYCAGATGQIDHMSWLRARGCEWPSDLTRLDTCTHAARAGNLHVLQWARANGCRWD
jgi:hypothetical protein